MQPILTRRWASFRGLGSDIGYCDLCRYRCTDYTIFRQSTICIECVTVLPNSVPYVIARHDNNNGYSECYSYYAREFNWIDSNQVNKSSFHKAKI